MITRYCGLVKGLNHNLCHFMPPKKQTKIILIFCALLQTKNNFQDIPRLLCAFPCILNSFSVHFPFDPLRSVKHNILWFLPHRLPPRFPLAPRRGAGRKQRPQAEISLEKSAFFAFFPLSKRCKACYNTNTEYCGAQARLRCAPPAYRRTVFDTKEASP